MSLKIFCKQIINLHANRFSYIPGWKGEHLVSFSLCQKQCVRLDAGTVVQGCRWGIPSSQLGHAHTACTAWAQTGSTNSALALLPGMSAHCFTSPHTGFSLHHGSQTPVKRVERVKQQVKLHQEPFKSQFRAVALSRIQSHQNERDSDFRSNSQRST